MSIQDIDYNRLIKEIKETAETFKEQESNGSYKIKVAINEPIWHTTTTANLKTEEE